MELCVGLRKLLCYRLNSAAELKVVFSRDSWQISVDWHAAGLAQIIFYLFVWWEVPSEDSVLNPQTPRLSKRFTKRFLWRLFSLFL